MLPHRPLFTTSIMVRQSCQPTSSKDGEIKEKFSYEILFNRKTQQSLVAYSQANYGPEAVFPHMTDEEKANFITFLGISNTLLGHYRASRRCSPQL